MLIVLAEIAKKIEAAPTNTTHCTSEIYKEFSFDFSGRFAIFAEEFPASTERVWVEMGCGERADLKIQDRGE